jgi:FkbM family methyltransferase
MSRLRLRTRARLLRQLVAIMPVGHGLRGRVGVLAVGAETLLRRAVRRPLRPEGPRFVTLDVEGRPCRVAVREFSDLDVARHVLRDRVYDVALDVPPEVVLDLGSNIGLSVLWFRHRFPSATIVAVEPDPRAVALLERNAGALPRTHLLHAAVTGSPGPRRLVLADATVSSALGESGDAGVEVEGVTIAALMRRFGLSRVDLLKIDIEGAEWEVLSDWTSGPRPAAVVGEFHPAALPVPLEDMLRVLDGYEIVPRDRSTEGHFEFVARRRGSALGKGVNVARAAQAGGGAGS